MRIKKARRDEQFPKFIRLSEAVKIAAERGVTCTYQTMLKWCKICGLGHKIGGRWFARRKYLLQFIEEEPIFYEEPKQDSEGN